MGAYHLRMVPSPETAIADLSVEERLSLIEALWDSLSDAETPLPDAQRTELERRLEGFESEKDRSESWNSIRAGLRSRT